MTTSHCALFVLVTAMSATVIGCSWSGSSTSSGPEAHSAAALRRMQSCEELTSALREDATSKMNRRIDAEIRGIREGYPAYYGYGWGPRGGMAMDDIAMPSTATATGTTAETNSTAASNPTHSETETQVKGVDEADIVKADGTRLYVLHGQKFMMVDAWPAPAMALAGGTDIEGEPTEMFVANGKAVVFSTADGTALYTATGVTPRAGYSDTYATPMYVGADMAMSGGYYGQTQNSVTKVTVLDIAGNSATVTREFYFEGRYLSSRRVDKKVRLVLAGGAHGPTLDYDFYSKMTTTTNVDGTTTSPSTEDQIAALESLRVKNQQAIDATSYSDWLPLGFSKNEAGVEVNPTACNDFYVPTAGSTEFGMTQLAAFDLDAPSEPPQSVSILGETQTVYGNAGSMVLAGRAYVDPWTLRSAITVTDGASTTTETTTAPPVESLNSTHLHVFDLSSATGENPSTWLPARFRAR